MVYSIADINTKSARTSLYSKIYGWQGKTNLRLIALRHIDLNAVIVAKKAV